jgi:hypothetical protein
MFFAHFFSHVLTVQKAVMPLDKSQWLFLIGCMPTRLALTWVVKHSRPGWHFVLAAILVSIGSGFLYMFATGQRLVGPETQGKPIWWRPFRLVHGLLYVLAALALGWQHKPLWAFYLLLTDTVLGLLNFLYHYWPKH